jgi:hypothetical protein
MLVWRNFECVSWPSIVIVGPNGIPLLFMKGEGNWDRIDVFIREAYRFYIEDLDKEPIPRMLECEAEA